MASLSQEIKNSVRGMVGYVGPKNVVPLILDGLKRLECRGHDSVFTIQFNSSSFFLMSKITEGLAPDVNASWPVRKADPDKTGNSPFSRESKVLQRKALLRRI